MDGGKQTEGRKERQGRRERREKSRAKRDGLARFSPFNWELKDVFCEWRSKTKE